MCDNQQPGGSHPMKSLPAVGNRLFRKKPETGRRSWFRCGRETFWSFRYFRARNTSGGIAGRALRHGHGFRAVGYAVGEDFAKQLPQRRAAANSKASDAQPTGKSSGVSPGQKRNVPIPPVEAGIVLDSPSPGVQRTFAFQRLKGSPPAWAVQAEAVLDGFDGRCQPLRARR